MRKRVVITGLGAVTPLGNDVSTYWTGLVAGRSGVGPITLYDASGEAVRFAAEVKGFDPVALLGRKQAKRSDRFVQLALAAADEAISDAGLPLGSAGYGRRVGVILGTGIGGIGTLLDNADLRHERGSRRVSALMIPMMMANAGAGEIAIKYGFRGQSLAMTSACVKERRRYLKNV